MSDSASKSGGLCWTSMSNIITAQLLHNSCSSKTNVNIDVGPQRSCFIRQVVLEGVGLTSQQQLLYNIAVKSVVINFAAMMLLIFQ